MSRIVRRLIGKLYYITKRIYEYVKSLFGYKQTFEITSEFYEVLDILNNTHDSLLLTGKAGTGKSSLLRYFMKHTGKKFAIIAPTGVAAQNVDGRTIHSFFHFAPTIKPENVREDHFLVEKLLDIDMIIIDEISMVRPDIMECIDVSLKRNRHTDNAFGGVQMVFVGDLYQLPPVIVEDEKPDIIRRYGGEYFFYAPVFQKGYDYNRIELTKVFRQDKKQSLFKDILNRIRTNTALPEDLHVINNRHGRIIGNDDKSIIITAKKNDAANKNAERLAMLNGELFTFQCEYDGDYSALVRNQSEDLPAPILLEVKQKAHIMMITNDAGNRWVNGSLGVIDKIDEGSIWVRFEDGKRVLVERTTWENKNPNGEVTGSYKQFPMQLAYAITIHKSQGKTFDSICINICNGAWDHGQVYVALSRCKTLEGITLLSSIITDDIIVDPVITKFLDDRIITIENQPQYSIKETLDVAISEHKRVKMKYTNADNITTDKIVGRLSYGNTEGTFKGFYDNENHPRNFRVDNITDIIIL